MCDYSLRLIASRPARVGDKLVSTSFPHTITRGLPRPTIAISPSVCSPHRTCLRERGPVRDWYDPLLGARTQGGEVSTSQQRPVKPPSDALEFPDGKTVLLTQLCKGQRATVLQLPAGIGVTVDDVQSKDSTVASPVAANLVAGAD